MILLLVLIALLLGIIIGAVSTFAIMQKDAYRNPYRRKTDLF